MSYRNEPPEDLEDLVEGDDTGLTGGNKPSPQEPASPDESPEDFKPLNDFINASPQQQRRILGTNVQTPTRVSQGQSGVAKPQTSPPYGPTRPPPANTKGESRSISTDPKLDLNEYSWKPPAVRSDLPIELVGFIIAYDSTSQLTCSQEPSKPLKLRQTPFAVDEKATTSKRTSEEKSRATAATAAAGPSVSFLV